MRITDFGTSKKLQGSSSLTLHKGTPIYCPPEFLTSYLENPDQKIHTSTKHDIFSLGILAHQIFSDGQHPFGKEKEIWNNIRNGKYSINYKLIKKESSIDQIIKGKNKKLRNEINFFKLIYY